MNSSTTGASASANAPSSDRTGASDPLAWTSPSAWMTTEGFIPALTPSEYAAAMRRSADDRFMDRLSANGVSNFDHDYRRALGN